MQIYLEQLPEPQYAHQVKKGDTVKTWNKNYRVQDDKGWLHIVKTEHGRREKIDIKDLHWQPGTLQDYIFNGWHSFYTENEFLTMAAAELAWLK